MILYDKYKVVGLREPGEVHSGKYGKIVLATVSEEKAKVLADDPNFSFLVHAKKPEKKQEQKEESKGKS